MSERGYHWIGHLPDGRCVLLYADPILKKTHTEMAPPFATHLDAIRYCRKQHIRLESTAIADGARIAPPKPGGVWSKRLTPNQARTLAALTVKADSTGVAFATIPEMVETAQMPEGTVRAILVSLCAKGYIARTKLGYGKDPSTYQILKGLDGKTESTKEILASAAKFSGAMKRLATR